MDNIINLIVFISYGVVVTLLLIAVVRLAMSNKRITNSAVQLSMDKLILLAQVEKLASEHDSTSIEKTDGFLKFISESRDWAFEYIENIQEALTEYDNALNADDARVLNDAYKKLIDFLPKDDVVK